MRQNNYFTYKDFNAKTEFMHTPMSTKLLVLAVTSQDRLWALQEMERLNEECFLPLEWMETTMNGQTLQVSHCQIKRQNKNPYFQILLRDIHDSIISTIIISSNLEKKSVRGIFLTEVPTDSQSSITDQIKPAIIEVRNRMESISSYSCHPLLLPLQLLESKLQELEQSCAAGLPAATLMSLSHEVERVRNLRQKKLGEGGIDIPMTTEGIYEAHLHLRRGQRRLSDIKAIMRAMIEGNKLLVTETFWQVANEDVFDCVKGRLRFLQERIRAVEKQLEIMVNEFQSLDTMLYNSISQQDSRLSYSIARDSKRIAVGTRRDSSAMKTIAILTIVFLPGTFIAALFSTGLFKFTQPSSSDGIISPELWIYWVITIPVTGFVIMAWVLWSRNVQNRDVAAVDIEDNVVFSVPVHRTLSGPPNPALMVCGTGC